ncbi:hypothetical protein [Bordetella trematum]|uniref:hypothetical protein n=1 Tax=Bordetella trematum TaxID=123899 RepID=UPI0015825E0A|nr:hypothetical protein [Bordetella trematum]
MKGAFVGVLALVLSGCASITGEKTQLVRVDVLDEQGAAVGDAKCELKNDKGEYQIESGKHAMVNKSGENLSISCKSAQRTDEASGTAISRAGAGMFGNILFGGGIGAIIDHNRGTAYNYPEWVQVVFGRIVTFDRSKYTEGRPMQGDVVEVAEAKEAATSSASIATPVSAVDRASDLPQK